MRIAFHLILHKRKNYGHAAERDKAEVHPFTSHPVYYSSNKHTESFFPQCCCPRSRRTHQQDHLAFAGCASSLHNVPRTNLQTRSAWRVPVLIYCRAAVVDFCLQDQRKAYSNKPALLRKLESTRSGIKLSMSRPGLECRPAVSLQPELQAELCWPKDKSKPAPKGKASIPALVAALLVPSHAFGPLHG